ncbi:MAG: hypothetical protein IME99_04900 [Proteobacteria bacterium]|nr:hypothetical protein [Pseudomonadota bacterium]
MQFLKMMKNRTKNRRSTAGLLALFFAFGLTSLVMVGCGAKAPIGRLDFHPSERVEEWSAGTDSAKSVEAKGTRSDKDDLKRDSSGKYTRRGDRMRFENSDVTVTVEEARDADGTAAFDVLREREFVLLKMSISNRNSRQKVRYDPVITALRDSTMGYSKPLDYPTLYEIGMSDRALERGLVDFRRSFYDLGITVPPLQTVTRYLIFWPVSKGAKRAQLVIKNLYAGEEIIDLTFAFDLLEAPKGAE